MIKEKVKIQNESGLHARPAAALVKLASKYKSEFFIEMYGYRVNGKSILGVMTLAADHNTEIELILDGPDEKEALDAIIDLVNNKFDSE